MASFKDEEIRLTITEWVNLYTDDLFKYAYSRLSNKEAAEDIVQNVFVVACENCDRFMNQSSPKTWLLGIMKNKIADFYRKSYTENTILSEFPEEINISGDKYFTEDGDWQKRHIPSEWYEAEESILENPDFNKILDQCLNNLPVKWHSAINLKYLDEESSEKICESLGISKQNYWQVISRAKLMLRECLSTNWFENR